MPDGETKATFEAVKDGHSLWIYAVKNGEKQPLREVKWAFIDHLDNRMEHEDMRVGVYAAKPTADDDDAEAKIVVDFEDLQVESAT